MTQLEALEKIQYMLKGYETAIEPLQIIESTLKDYEILCEQLEKANNVYRDLMVENERNIKALEIIKEKDVSMYWLRHSKNVDEYNNFILTDKRQYQKLTQEEYDLLKEVLL